MKLLCIFASLIGEYFDRDCWSVWCWKWTLNPTVDSACLLLGKHWTGIWFCHAALQEPTIQSLFDCNILAAGALLWAAEEDIGIRLMILHPLFVWFCILNKQTILSATIYFQVMSFYFTAGFNGHGLCCWWQSCIQGLTPPWLAFLWQESGSIVLQSWSWKHVFAYGQCRV